jgi:hypothetical protein
MTGSRVIVCPLKDRILKCLGDNEKVFVAEESIVGVGIEVTSFVEEIVN